MKKKHIFLIAGAAVAAVLLAVVIFLLLRDDDSEKLAAYRDAGIYSGYHIVVVARNTPDEVLDELWDYGIHPVEHVRNSQLIGAGGIVDTSLLPDGGMIFLCQGTYDAGTGDFIRLENTNSLTITGAGTDQTIIKGGGLVTASLGTGIHIGGTQSAPAENILVEDLSITDFRNGVHMVHARNITLKNVELTRNQNNGIWFENTMNSRVEASRIEENGNPRGNDTGYGLMFTYNSFGNEIVDTVYINNANNNAVDSVFHPQKQFPEGNNISMEMSHNIERIYLPVIDPIEVAFSARPGENSIFIDLAGAELTGAELTRRTERVEQYSGEGYVFLYDGSITIEFHLEQAGFYRVFVVGATTEPNSKCDYVTINGGPRFLTSFLYREQGKWVYSQPGTEVWINHELRPNPQVDGFEMRQGSNVIVISANWGYAAYDSIYLELIQ